MEVEIIKENMPSDKEIHNDSIQNCKSADTITKTEKEHLETVTENDVLIEEAQTKEILTTDCPQTDYSGSGKRKQSNCWDLVKRELTPNRKLLLLKLLVFSTFGGKWRIILYTRNDEHNVAAILSFH